MRTLLEMAQPETVIQIWIGVRLCAVSTYGTEWQPTTGRCRSARALAPTVGYQIRTSLGRSGGVSVVVVVWVVRGRCAARCPEIPFLSYATWQGTYGSGFRIGITLTTVVRQLMAAHGRTLSRPTIGPLGVVASSTQPISCVLPIAATSDLPLASTAWAFAVPDDEVKDWVNEIEIQQIEPMPSQLVDKRLIRRENDVLLRARFRGRDAYVLIILEFQSRPDRFMSLRLLAYTCLVCLSLVELSRKRK